MKLFKKFKTVINYALGATLAFSTSALAQSSDWIQPAVGVLGDFESGLITVAQVVAAVGVIAYGIMSAVTGRFDIGRISALGGGAILAVFGGELAKALLA